MLNTQDNFDNWDSKEDPIFDKLNNLKIGDFNRSINTDWETRTSKIDYKASREKTDWKAKVAKTDYKARTEKIDYKKHQAKRLNNINFESRSEKYAKPILQYDKQGNFIKEWKSAKVAADELGFKQTNINANCLGKLKTAYGFIWKFK